MDPWLGSKDLEFDGSSRRGRISGAGDDDVIISSNAQTLPRLIIPPSSTNVRVPLPLPLPLPSLVYRILLVRNSVDLHRFVSDRFSYLESTHFLSVCIDSDKVHNDIIKKLRLLVIKFFSPTPTV